MLATSTLGAINRALESEQEDKLRTHLGASIIGRECARDVWYTFRWAQAERHEARILRLFDRGKREEERFTEWLRKAGITVNDYDEESELDENGSHQQYRVGWASGHAGGSLDAEVYGVPERPDEWGVGEYKTHGEKSFLKLVEEGVRNAKPEHYVQMQIYMHKRNRGFALYLAINKNTDEIHAEIVPYDRETALRYIERAENIIAADQPPPRISATPSWFKCRMCSHKGVCHNGKPLARNCRTCVWSMPTADKTWTCRRYNYPLTADDQRRGCDDWSPIQ